MAKSLYLKHALWVIWVIIIAVLSFIPGNQFPSVDFAWIAVDKVVHFVLYFVLFILMGYAFLYKKMNPSTIWLYVLLISVGIVFGFFVELVQEKCIYQRYFDLSDVVANSIGTIFGAITMRWIGIKIV